MSDESILVYLMRRDLRASDNLVLTRLSTAEHGFTHLLPVYIFPPDQIEVSGLVKDGKMSPYPPARYSLSQRWKCGHLRAKFIAESLWNLRANLENLGSGLVMRVGDFGDVLNSIIHHYAANQQGPQVTAVWMTEDYSPDQQKEEETVSAICNTHDIKFDLLYDVKYFMHE
jgi:deoxyribodipyrimidine photo-lyase